MIHEIIKEQIDNDLHSLLLYIKLLTDNQLRYVLAKIILEAGKTDILKIIGILDSMKFEIYKKLEIEND